MNKLLTRIVLAIFLTNTFVPPGMAANVPSMPAPGTLASLSPNFHPSILQGVLIKPDQPLELEFLVDPGDSPPGRSRL